MTNFSDMVSRMTKSCANIEVTNEEQLLKTIGQLLGSSQEVLRIIAAAKQFAEAEEYVLDNIVEELQPFLKNLNTQGNIDAST
jgi:3-deoxy-D-manno-octulosonic-acid transferase